MCLIFSLINSFYGTIKNCSSYLFEDSYEANVTLNKYKELECFVIVGKKRVTAVPTANLLGLKQFSSLYMDDVKNICLTNVVKKYMEKNDKCIIFVCTDTYWCEGVIPNELFQRILSNNGICKTKVCQGTFGDYYLIEKK